MATQIYNYDPVTKEFIPTRNPVFARVDRLDPDNIPVPANATLIAPPRVSANSIQVFITDTWAVKVDYRGTEYTDHDGNVIVITEIGVPVPDTASDEYKQGVRLAKFTAKALDLAKIKSNRNNVFPFMFGGNIYKNDEINIFGVKIAAFGKPVTNPLQTFIGTANEGKWKTDDRQYIAFTYQEFMDGVFETYFIMRSDNFTNADRLYTELLTMYADPTKTDEDIVAFDISVGWSDVTVAPEPEPEPVD